MGSKGGTTKNSGGKDGTAKAGNAAGTQRASAPASAATAQGRPARKPPAAAATAGAAAAAAAGASAAAARNSSNPGASASTPAAASGGQQPQNRTPEDATDATGADELARNIRRSWSSVFQGISRNTQAHQECMEAYQDIRQSMTDVTTLAATLDQHIQRITHKAANNASHMSSEQAASIHIVAHLPLLLVYVGMGLADRPANTPLPKQQKETAAKLFQGCKSFRAYVDKYAKEQAPLSDKAGEGK